MRCRDRPAGRRIEKIDVGNTAHWIAVSHATGKVFASVKSDYLVAIDASRRAVIDRIALPHVVEGLAVTPDGEGVRLRSGRRGVLCRRRAHACRHRTVPIDGADGQKRQMRRVRVSPDNAYVVVSSNQDRHAAIYDGTLKQIASIVTKRSPMGFGFAPGGKLAYLCCHDDAEVLEFELATGRVTPRLRPRRAASSSSLMDDGEGARCRLPSHPRRRQDLTRNGGVGRGSSASYAACSTAPKLSVHAPVAVRPIAPGGTDSNDATVALGGAGGCDLSATAGNS